MRIGKRAKRSGTCVFTIAWFVACSAPGDPPAGASDEQQKDSVVEVQTEEVRSPGNQHRRPSVAPDRREPSSPAREFRIFDQVQLGAWTVTMEKTSMSQVREMVGTGEIVRVISDSEPMWYLCLLARDRTDTVFVAFESGLMGEPGRAITGVHIGMGRPPYDAPCSEIPVDPYAISIQHVLELGMRRSDVRDQLGAPAEPPDPLRPVLEEYAPLDDDTEYFERVTAIDEPTEHGLNSYDVSNSALATFRHDRLVGLVVWKVSTT